MTSFKLLYYYEYNNTFAISPVNEFTGRQSQISEGIGGSIQKVIVAHEINRKPQVFICAQPTRGINIGVR